MVIAAKRAVAVIIGRNESKSLALSLASVRDAGLPVVYADSGSTDGSLKIAQEFGAATVALTPDRPFSAARGRNEGLELARRLWPHVEFVQFLDGDCTLDPGFVRAALNLFDHEPRCAVITGHLSERHPDASLYNRLCAIEWRSPAGPIENMNGLGGIMMARISALQEIGGFNERAIAGEEPDLGVRLSLAGFKLIKIDQAIATHDADMRRFGQWWLRAVRGGHAIAHRYARHGKTPLRDGRRELLSDLFWGLILPAAILVMVWPTSGFSLLLLMGYAVLYWRIRRHHLSSGLGEADAALVARFTVATKFAHVVGVARYLIARIRGEYQIIDWK